MEIKDINFETKLYTSIWEFVAPFSYEETLAKIEEWKWILTLTRYEVRTRIVDQLHISATAVVTVILDTNKTPILCFEEVKMTDKKKEEVTTWRKSKRKTIS
jgi:hypothetical protein